MYSQPFDLDTCDPVCGMAVNPVQVERHRHRGHDYWFCSPSCLSKFRADPSAYLGPREIAPAPACCGGASPTQGSTLPPA